MYLSHRKQSWVIKIIVLRYVVSDWMLFEYQPKLQLSSIYMTMQTVSLLHNKLKYNECIFHTRKGFCTLRALITV